MTIPFFRSGFALPVAQALLVLLDQEVAKAELNLERLTQLTFNFRNPGYSAEQGGVHPVEIRLIRGLDGWQKRGNCSISGRTTSLPTAGWSASASRSQEIRRTRCPMN
jgi:hypothetical protein